MLRSMFSGLAGLSNNQTGLDVVGNNIANVNTIGYKGSKIEFTELLNQTIRGASSPQDSGRGGTNPIQVGLGVGTSAISVSHQQGNLLSTGLMSDLALQGNGFFILGDGGTQQFYSRAGSFNFDADGYLVHSSGMKAYGWMASLTGVIDRNSSIQALSIPVGQTIAANETTEITYAYNLDSRAYTIGTPLLASGNSANVSTVTGKFGISNDNLTTPENDAIVDVKGTHSFNVFAETHNGTNTALNGTQSIGDDLGVTNVSNFRVVIDGTSNTINLSNGTASTVNEVISAINSQLPGVTAILTNGSIRLTRDTAGAQKHIYVYDSNTVDMSSFEGLTSTSAHGAPTAVTSTEAEAIWNYLKDNDYIDATGKVVADLATIAALDLSAVPPTGVGANLDFTDLKKAGVTLLTESLADHITSTSGIASKLFGSGTNEWLPASKTLGTKNSLTLTSALTGLDVTNDIVVTANGTTYTFAADEAVLSPALAATSTVADLITKFNSWSAIQADGTQEGVDPFYMGLNKDGKLFITYTTADKDIPISAVDSSPADNDGIMDMFFSKNGNWDAETATTVNLNRLSTTAYITHSFSRADGGGTTALHVQFDGNDTRIIGLPNPITGAAATTVNGMDIVSIDSGFKTGRFVLQTVPATEHLTSSTVYDSLGNERTVTLTLTRTEDNTWNWTASGTGVTGSGSLAFDNQGVLISVGQEKISVGGQGGANSLDITPDFFAVSQYADSSTMVHANQDGYPNGSLSTYSISADGTIIGIYSNGLNQNIGQIGVATFNNPTGLLKGSDGMFMSSNNSGEAQIGSANTGGRGTISAGTLEMSNVDIAKEFANMIIYQRGFQANSKIITTGDEILQTLVNMKR